MMGIDPAQQRDMMEESLEAILLLLAGETVTMETDWFTLVKARLQLRPTSAPSPRWPWPPRSRRPARARPAASAAACSRSVPPPAGGFDVLGAHWDVMEERAAEFSTTVDRNQWRLVGPMHIADTKEQAIADVAFGLEEWVDYFQRVAALPLAPNTENFESLVDALNASGFAVIGTVEDAIAQIERLQAQSGGFGTFLLMGHEWADTAATRHSYELIARYVAPHVPGLVAHADRQPGLGGREPARIHRRRGQRRHVGHPEAPRGEGREGRPRPRRRRTVAEITHEQVADERDRAPRGRRRARPTGAPVVLCHGFPELWYSWRHQLGALGDAGYRAIAPDLRGYGGSSAPHRGRPPTARTS